MLKSFNGLTQQLFEKPYRRMLYSIYNFAEEEFYIHGLKNLGFENDVDSLEFITLDVDNISNNEILLFKQYIESDLQKGNVIVGVLLYKGKMGVVPVVIKPKGIDINDVLKERQSTTHKINDFQSLL